MSIDKDFLTILMFVRSALVTYVPTKNKIHVFGNNNSDCDSNTFDQLITNLFPMIRNYF